MGDLKLGKIPLGNVTLERLDVCRDKHLRVLGTLRDDVAIEMCYDVQYEIKEQENGVEPIGNHFLFKNDGRYCGYVYISDEYKGERTLAYIVQEKVRCRGIGKVMLTSVSKYLFDCCDTASLKLNINNDNTAGIGLATSCGFIPNSFTDSDVIRYGRKK